MADAAPGLALQRLLQLASPSLPVGAFAYSEGLETAVADGRLTGADSVADWLRGVFDYAVVPVDLAMSQRLHTAWATDCIADVSAWSAALLATRESAERRAQERHLGHALANLLTAMDIPDAGDWRLGRTHAPAVSFAALWSLAAVRWQIPLADSLSAMAWAWLENQVLAAVKLVPLGQTAGQRLLFELAGDIPAGVARAMHLPDAALGGSLPALAVASAAHETLYSRLYRS
ncbi:urease accessory UreF family protein [uncultured Salinisphaera sp.]|uniref:urease accessory protein UreF n=1 Tax=uncultured Salinisphaera sp. TaxID=359372 RepID=UPI0032B17485|tara:strand:- start:8951 stop:9646 length:696 start_codon:yes stop_codon:yes gene_type:complete